MIGVKVVANRGTKKAAIFVPAFIDSDGLLTITNTEAFGATELLRSELYPETVKALDLTGFKRKKYTRKASA